MCVTQVPSQLSVSQPRSTKRWVSTTVNIWSRRRAKKSCRTTWRSRSARLSRRSRSITRVISRPTSLSTGMVSVMPNAIRSSLLRFPSLRLRSICSTTRWLRNPKSRSLWWTRGYHSAFSSRIKAVVLWTLPQAASLTRVSLRSTVPSPSSLISSWRRRRPPRAVCCQRTSLCPRTTRTSLNRSCSIWRTRCVTSTSTGLVPLKCPLLVSTLTKSLSSSWTSEPTRSRDSRSSPAVRKHWWWSREWSRWWSRLITVCTSCDGMVVMCCCSQFIENIKC